MNVEEINTVREELEKLFITLQKIDAPMTEHNIAIMNACLGSVKFLFNIVANAKEKDGADDGDSNVK